MFSHNYIYTNRNQYHRLNLKLHKVVSLCLAPQAMDTAHTSWLVTDKNIVDCTTNKWVCVFSMTPSEMGSKLQVEYQNIMKMVEVMTMGLMRRLWRCYVWGCMFLMCLLSGCCHYPSLFIVKHDGIEFWEWMALIEHVGLQQIVASNDIWRRLCTVWPLVWALGLPDYPRRSQVNRGNRNI